jgi:ribosome-associated protein
LEEKKGENILLMDIREQASFADYFVICSGTSERMLKALLDVLDEQIGSQFKRHARLEGRPQDGWMLADYGDVVVHIFSPDRRNYYRLEDLWSKSKVLLHVL